MAGPDGIRNQKRILSGWLMNTEKSARGRVLAMVSRRELVAEFPRPGAEFTAAVAAAPPMDRISPLFTSAIVVGRDGAVFVQKGANELL
jgi:hypothetical protein